MSNILCIMERSYGESDTNQGYQNYLEYPSLRFIKKVSNYHDASWPNDGNDSGQSAYIGSQIYQVNCYGENLLKYTNPLNPEFIDVIYQSSNWGPTGIAINGNQVVILSATNAQLEFRNLSDISTIIKAIALDTTTYGEHDGLYITPNNHFLMATDGGYIVEMDNLGNYIRTKQLDSDYYRGAALIGSTIVTADQKTQYIVLVDYITLNEIKRVDFSPYLNTSGNEIYGSFFIDSAIAKL